MAKVPRPHHPPPKKEHWTRHDWDIYRALLNPAIWGQSHLKNRDGSKRIYWGHQCDDLMCGDRNIVHQDGRDVGKTICLSTLVLHYAFITKGGCGLVAAPHQGHLDTVIDEVEFQLFDNPLLEQSLARNVKGNYKIVRNPYYKFEFTNGTVIHFRPAGAYGECFRSLHVDRLWIDEAALIPEKAWKAIRQCVKRDGYIRAYSTPDGRRNTVYYRMTKSPRYTVFRWPSWENPNWTEAQAKELEEFYGGKETPGWLHEVAGEHGAPSFSVFNVERFHACRRDLPEYQFITISAEALEGCETEADYRERLDALMNLAPLEGTYWVGGDLGYSNDPTEITIWEEREMIFHSGNVVTSEKNRGQIKPHLVTTQTVMRLVFRVRMERIAYPLISEAIGIIDRYFKPRGIGVDNGGNGGAVVQELSTLDKYRELDLGERLLGVDFGSSTVTSVNEDGKPLKRPTKEYMTQLLVAAFQRRTILLPLQDVDLEDEFLTHTYMLNNGRVKYSRGNDHIIDSARCAFLVRDRQRYSEAYPEVITDLPYPMATDPLDW